MLILKQKLFYVLSALSALIIIFLLSNIDKGIIIKPVEQMQLEFSALTPVTIEEIKERLPHITIEDAEQNIIRVDPQMFMKTINDVKLIPGVVHVNLVPGMPDFSWHNYGQGIAEQLSKVLNGDLGTVISRSQGKESPLTDYLPTMIATSFSYLIPGLLLGILIGILFAIFASLRPKIGYWFDQIHKVFILFPDFVVVVALQLIVIYLTKFASGRIILIAQIGTETPFLLPLLTISFIPGVMVYGTVRAAIVRELAESYVKTAYAKGLSAMQVLIRHIMRNVMEDLFAILPRATTSAVTAMVIVEVMCLILGVGGFVLSKYYVSIGTLPTICIILALFTIAMHLIFAWLRQKFVIPTGEVDRG